MLNERVIRTVLKIDQSGYREALPETIYNTMFVFGRHLCGLCTLKLKGHEYREKYSLQSWQKAIANVETPWSPWEIHPIAHFMPSSLLTKASVCVFVVRLMGRLARSDEPDRPEGGTI